MNKLSGDVVHQLRQRGGTGLAEAKTSYLRLEKVALHAPTGDTGAIRLDGVVSGRSYHGSHSTYTIDSHGSSIRALVPEGGGWPLEQGSAAHLYIDPSSILQY